MKTRSRSSLLPLRCSGGNGATALPLGALVVLCSSMPAHAQEGDPVHSSGYSPNVDNESCLRCHADPGLQPVTDRGRQLDLLVEEDYFKDTFHEYVACVDCHQGAESFSRVPHNGGRPLTTTCGFCHDRAAQQYGESVHGSSRASGDLEAPNCSTCHGRHTIYPVADLRSPVNPFRLAETCATCHRGGAMLETHDVGQKQAVNQYVDSIHGTALLRDGLVVAPTCNDCHGVHDIQPREHPDSKIHKTNVPDTCGHCHVLVERIYNQSIHGELLAKGDERGPTCIQCHSSHEISEPRGREFRLGIDDKCGDCHEERLRRYRETFHGKAIALGRENVAACSDCHGHHDMRPASDPTSHINEKNRLETCRTCHPKANQNFAGYLVHADHSDRESSPQVYWVFIFMTTLLIGTFLFFAVHTILWTARSAAAFVANFRRFRELKLAARRDPEQYVRFAPTDRFLHALIISSFLLLVITGMPLKFYYTDWAQWMFELMDGQPVAALLHRVGAIITLFYFSVHLMVLAHRIWTRRDRFRDPDTGRYTVKSIGRQIFGPDSPIPTFQDLRDLWAHQKWFFGKGEQPQFDRWTYWEKFDYMGVFWGVAVIGLSGLIMWFPEVFTTVLPGWIINVALVVHSDEALLATGFIFTFHFFNVHFRLEKFPIDPVMFSGRISRTELEHERGRLLERWQQSGELDRHKVKDEWGSWKKIAIPLGFMAFLVGLIVIFLVYSAMITRLLHN